MSMKTPKINFKAKLIYFKIPAIFLRYFFCRSGADPRSRRRIVDVILIELSQRLPLSIVNENVRPTASHVLDRLLWAPAVLLHEITTD